MTLEGWYRCLMLAYPRGYRRSHGEELVTILLDAVPPGRARPTFREVVDLLRGGLRQRFRLPVGKAPLVVAVLTALIVGAFGSAAGAWLGWRAAAPLPADPAARSITTMALGQPYIDTFYRNEGLLESGHTMMTYAPVRTAAWSAADARARFAGWRIEPGGNDWFAATQGGLRVRVFGHDGVVDVVFYQVEPPWVPIATAAGWLAGAVSGWLLVGWAWYAARGSGPRPRIAVQTTNGTLRWSPPLYRAALGLLSAVGLAALARPAVATYDELLALYAEPVDPWAPKLPSWSWYTWYAHLTMAGMIALTLAVAVAAAARAAARQPTVASELRDTVPSGAAGEVVTQGMPTTG
ncbi:hypothetical protein [Micromonospora sp. SL4-19]|uniref:hypothetical protein n=1 Tax=Micromonospora sp. SL4-19 TaxID=3399129 RepID=UPI003A4DF08C